MRVVALLKCCHPAPTVAVTAFATLLALGAGKGAWAALIAAAVLAGQLSVGWGNDWVDRHRDRAVGRVDKPLVTGAIDERTVLAGSLAAGAASVVLSLLAAGAAGLLHIAAVAVAWSYDLGLKRTVFSPLPYVVAFGLLPAFVLLAHPVADAVPAWVVAAGALLGAGAHGTNALPDLEQDAFTGVRGLPHRVGPRATIVGSALLLGGGLVITWLGPSRPAGVINRVVLVAGLGLVAGVLIAGVSGHGRLAFRLTMGAAAAAVLGLLTA